MIGVPQVVFTRVDDTLADIAVEYGLGYDALVAANSWMIDHVGGDIDRIGRAIDRTGTEAAGPVFFLCSPWADYIHGQVLNVTGGQFGGMYT